MNYRKTCFFCCQYIKYDLNFKGVDNSSSTHSNFQSITNCDATSLPKSKVDIKSILQISQYLKVPRSLVAQLQENNDLVSLSVCEHCEGISETLSKLCRDVEVTKMKISHYLNLLTDRIIGINNDDEQKVNKEEIHFSDLQKDIHKKCLLKVRKLEDKATPQVILTKCQVGSSKPPQFELDDFKQDDYPVILEADEHQIKIELTTDNDPELHSCSFCNFTVNCGDMLDDHISNQHSELFETHNPIHLNSNSIYQIDNPKNTASSSNTRKRKRIHKKCEICGAVMDSTNLARHKRLCHNVFSNQNSTSNEHQIQIKCEFCPLTFTNGWNKLKHTKAVHLQSSNQIVRKKRVKKCEICGAMVTAKNLAAHKRSRHKNLNKNGLEIDTSKIDDKTKGFKCVVCGNNYALRRSLWRHYRNSEKCRIGKCIKIENKKDDGELEMLTTAKTQTKRFECVVCGNSYLARRSLWRHYRKSEKCGMVEKLRMENEKMHGNMAMLSSTEIIVENEEEIVVENLFENAEDPLKI